MNDNKLIYFNDLKKYFKKKDPFFTKYDSTFGESNTWTQGSPKLTINHQHHHYGYDWGPWWFWYPQQQNTTIINHNYNTKSSSEEDKKDKKGIAWEKLMAGLLMTGAVTGLSYFVLKDFFDYRQERNLFRNLKEMTKTTHNQLFVNAKPLMKLNLSYSRDFLISKTICMASSLILLADIFYWNDEKIMNSCFLVMAGSMIFGIGRYLYYCQVNQSSQSEASYRQVHAILYGEQQMGYFQETGPRPPAYNPDIKKDH